ncbi:MAG TPA: phenylalanine--tRNA ligase subunit alpha [Nitrososphaeraceae archaeon]|nr:phenylalanine--tRNA ligase subunit alpha [Nitrososphaeraceae archaeon]
MENTQINLAELHPIERKIISSLNPLSQISLTDLIELSALNLDQIRRGLEWLKYKNIIESNKPSTLITLDDLGRNAIEQGLPERRLVRAVRNGNITISTILEKGSLTQSEINIAISKAKSNKWINISSSETEGLTFNLIENFENASGEELLLNKIFSSKKLKEVDLTNSELEFLKLLVKRPKFIKFKKDEEKVSLTELGKKIKTKVDIKNINDKNFPLNKNTTLLVPKHLIAGKWKTLTFRPIDVEAKVAMANPGRKHPLTDLINEIREAFTSLGFVEIDGDFIQSAFWNFDALFTPQDHAARDMQDTFYLSEKITTKLGNKNLIKKIANTHILGWKDSWNIKIAKKPVLRTHTTPVTLKYLSETKPDEARIFTIGRVFRNEKVSYKHLVEFNQIEGVITGKKLTLRDLMGIQTEFYKKIGIKKIKFWPTYFPYTEPSLQSMIFNSNLNKWIELFGMGILRPEVVQPFGIRNIVLAWGGGIERIAMLKYEISDVRELYNNKIGWLRSLSKCQ